MSSIIRRMVLKCMPALIMAVYAPSLSLASVAAEPAFESRTVVDDSPSGHSIWTDIGPMTALTAVNGELLALGIVGVEFGLNHRFSFGPFVGLGWDPSDPNVNRYSGTGSRVTGSQRILLAGFDYHLFALGSVTKGGLYFRGMTTVGFDREYESSDDGAYESASSVGSVFFQSLTVGYQFVVGRNWALSADGGAVVGRELSDSKRVGERSRTLEAVWDVAPMVGLSLSYRL